MVEWSDLVQGTLEAFRELNRSRVWLLFSGGRDSYLVYRVLYDVKSYYPFELNVVYVDHGMDAPWMRLLAYRALLRMSEVEWLWGRIHVLTPRCKFWGYIFEKRYRFPTPKNTWHIRHLIAKPLRDFLRGRVDPQRDLVVMGSRYEDSLSKRVKQGPLVGRGTHNLTKLPAVFPVAGLKRYEVVKFISRTDIPEYNDYYPVKHGRPGPWIFLHPDVFDYYDFSERLGLSGARELYDFMVTIREMQRDPSNFGPKGVRWSSAALHDIKVLVSNLYDRLSDYYPGLYTPDEYLDYQGYALCWV